MTFFFCYVNCSVAERTLAEEEATAKKEGAAVQATTVEESVDQRLDIMAVSG